MEEPFTIRIKCPKCGNTKNVNKFWILDNVKNSSSLDKAIDAIKPRLTCTNCGTKNPYIIRIPAEQERRKPTKIHGRKRHSRKDQQKRHSFRENKKMEREILENQRSEYRKNLQIKKANKNPNKSHKQPGWHKISCPVCFGSGGLNGNCYRCHGTGWIDK